MDTSKEPADVVDSWQKWYQNNKVVASIEEPLVTKDSRENLHDTSKVSNSVFQTKIINEATKHFADTIAIYLSELSASQLYECFLQAALKQLNHSEQEYKKIKEFTNFFNINNENKN